MEMGDKAVGLVLTMTSLSIFTYYTFWVIILVSYFWAIHVSFLSYILGQREYVSVLLY